MRRFLMASLGLCASMASSAALLNNTQDNVVIPAFKGGFEFGLTGAWMEANYHHVGLVRVDASDNGFADGGVVDIDPERDFAYGAMVGYVFHDSANDVRFNFFNIETDDSESVSREGGHRLHRVAGFDDDNRFLNDIDGANGKVEFTLRSYDLEAAQHIDVGCHTSMRFFVGLSYHDLDKDTHYTYVERDTDTQGDDDVRVNRRSESMTKSSEFSGFGPRVGFDLSYAFNDGFGLVGHMSAAALVGEIDSKNRLAHVNNGETVAKSDVSIKSRCLVVPNLDLRLGVDYTHCFCSGTIVDAEVGYWTRSYFDAVNNTSIQEDESGKYLDQLDSVSFHGAYVTLRAHF